MGTAPPSGHPHVALKLRSAIDRRTSRPADYLLCQVRRREVRLAQDSGRAAQGPLTEAGREWVGSSPLPQRPTTGANPQPYGARHLNGLCSGAPPTRPTIAAPSGLPNS